MRKKLTPEQRERFRREREQRDRRLEYLREITERAQAKLDARQVSDT